MPLITLRITHWIYTAVVRPILTYGYLVWWESLYRNTKSKLIQRLQRSACIIINGALRNTHTSSLVIILGLFPLVLFCRGATAKISKYLWSDIDHAKILRKVGAVRSTDYMTPRYDFKKGFKTSVPDNGMWKGGMTHLLKNSVQIYTDSSKLN